MTRFVCALVAIVSLALFGPVAVLPASSPAAAGWKDNPNSGYCPPGTTTPNGGSKARDISHCIKK
jgi:hypothetical protein